MSIGVPNSPSPPARRLSISPDDGDPLLPYARPAPQWGPWPYRSRSYPSHTDHPAILPPVDVPQCYLPDERWQLNSSGGASFGNWVPEAVSPSMPHPRTSFRYPPRWSMPSDTRLSLPIKSFTSPTKQGQRNGLCLQILQDDIVNLSSQTGPSGTHPPLPHRGEIDDPLNCKT